MPTYETICIIRGICTIVLGIIWVISLILMIINGDFL